MSADSDEELEDLLGFFDYSYQPGLYKGAVVFHIKYPDGGLADVSVEAQDSGVSVRRGTDHLENSGRAVHCSMDRDVFLEVYRGDLHPRSAIMANQIHVRSWRYMELHKFSKAFDYSSEKWVDFYAWKDLQKAEIEEARRAEEERAAQEASRALAEEQLLREEFAGAKTPKGRRFGRTTSLPLANFINSREPFAIFLSTHEPLARFFSKHEARIAQYEEPLARRLDQRKQRLEEFLRSLTKFVPDSEMRVVRHLQRQRQQTAKRRQFLMQATTRGLPATASALSNLMPLASVARTGVLPSFAFSRGSLPTPLKLAPSQPSLVPLLGRLRSSGPTAHGLPPAVYRSLFSEGADRSPAPSSVSNRRHQGIQSLML